MDGEWTIEDCKTIENAQDEVLCIKWSPDDSLLAVSTSHSYIKIYSTSSFSLSKLISMRSATTMPFPSICWRPEIQPCDYKNIIFGVSADGYFAFCNGNTGAINCILQLDEGYGLCCDFSPDGHKVAIGCSDFKVAIYHSTEYTKFTVLLPGKNEVKGHCNRVFAVKWVNSVLLLSGGWDDQVLLWETSSGNVVRSFYKAHICGQSLDVHESVILAGCYDRENQIQLFDYATCSLMKSITLNRQDGKPGIIYSAGFTKDPEAELFAVVGDQIRIFESASYRLVCELGEGNEWFCCDWGNRENILAVGSVEGTVRIFVVNR